MRRIPIPVLLCLILVTSRAGAYPISPLPLRKVAMEADVIVVARVESVLDREGRPATKRWDGQIAVLRIEEVLRGDPGRSRLEVPFFGGMVCPEPPAYRAGMTGLVFLARSEREPEAMHTVGLSYGLRDVSDSSVRAAFLQRVRELLPILDAPDTPDRRRQLVDWLVDCALDPITRWDGTYELARRGDTMSEYDRTPIEDFAADLTDSHRRRLVEVLLSETGDLEDRGTRCLIELVAPWGDPPVLDRLRHELDSIGEEIPYDTAVLIRGYARGRRWDEGVSLCADFERSYRKDEKRAILRDFRDRMPR